MRRAVVVRQTAVMWSAGLRICEDASAADWIAPRLAGEAGTVTGTVPCGYPAYARICHPAEGAGGELVSWEQVAESTGRQPHPLMQWHALVGTPDYLNMQGSLWPGGNPQRGHLVPEALAPLCDLLAVHTTTPENCFFCLWEGWGWIDGAGRSITWSTTGTSPPVLERLAPAFSEQELSRPRVHLPDRDYLLFVGSLLAVAGTLTEAASAGRWRLDERLFEQSPNLFWPADRSWCVASEIDFDSTVVAGSTQLVQAILSSSTLDSWPIGPEESLRCDADLVNPVSEGD
jgi:hypothetical protein